MMRTILALTLGQPDEPVPDNIGNLANMCRHHRQWQVYMLRFRANVCVYGCLAAARLPMAPTR